MGTLIIAEAGVNHNGSLKVAMELCRVASEAGADYVKFQTFVSEKLVTAVGPMAEYQIAGSGTTESQLKMLKGLELSQSDHYALNDYCHELGIGFCSSPFDIESIGFLDSLGMDLWKIPSGEITNLTYLRAIGERDFVVLSTGMCTLADIEAALTVLEDGGTRLNQITLLHCNTEYPTPMNDVNLLVMETLHQAFGTAIGYSDHTRGIEIPIAAVAMGATIIEKHFTLDNSMTGPDHRASLNPAELSEMVASIRNLEIAMGSPIKKPTPSEIKNIPIARKSIVASMDISKGEEFTHENLTTKRPGTGVSPMRWDDIVGTRADRDYAADEMIDG